MSERSTQPQEDPAVTGGDRPRLTHRGGLLLAVSGLALIHGAWRAEEGFVHLGLLGLLLLGGSYFWAGRNLRHLSFARSTPESAFAGQFFPLTLTVGNDRRRLDAFAVEFEDSVAGPVEKGLRIHWLPAGLRATRKMQSRLLRRGLVHPARTGFESDFPLGLWRSRLELGDHLEMTVFPRPVPPALFEDPHLVSLLESDEPGVTDWDGDFHGLREFQPGDRVKWIHWPTTARSRHLVVRQFDRRQPGRVTLVFHSIRPDQKPRPADVFEGALELLCGLLLQLHERGIPVDLIASFNQWRKLSADSREDLQAALRTLATAKRVGERNGEALQEALRHMDARDRVIILSDGPVREWEGNLPELPCVTLCLSVAEIYVRPPGRHVMAPN